VERIKSFLDIHGCEGMTAEIYLRVIATLDAEWMSKSNGS
jgi:hypothetical protein